jgi:Ca2+-binding RTX toxin-like protein
MRMALVPAALTLALLLLCAPARAATVTGASHIEGGVKGPEFSVFDLSVRADPGERSDLTITVSAAGGGFRADVSDTAAPLLAAGSCRQAGALAVTCDGPSALGRFSAELGDGNDRLAFVTSGTGFSATITAGPGDDEITGGPAFDSIDGGGGLDVLRGGGGGDSLADGDAPGAADADVLDGGPGDDAVSYEDRGGALVIDLSTGRSGEAGEDDRLTGIEGVRGGTGRDVITGTSANESLSGGSGGPDVITAGDGADSVALGAGGRADAGPGEDLIDCGAACIVEAGAGPDDVTGSDAADRIRGGPGRDEVFALAGDDVVDGGSGNDILGGGFAEGVASEQRRDGRDRIAGGAGNDRLVDSSEVDRYDGGPGRDLVLALDRRADRVRCGSGRDRLVGDRRERARGCERRVVGAHVRLAGSRRLELAGREFTVELECPGYALVSCRGRLEAWAGGTLVGRGRYRGTTALFGDVRLTAAGRRLLRRGGRVTVIARGGDATGAIHVTRRQFRLTR